VPEVAEVAQLVDVWNAIIKVEKLQEKQESIEADE